MEISVLDIYNYLPKTNCKDCGCESCMAFAIALLEGKRTLNNCMHLMETKHIRNRAALVKSLSLDVGTLAKVYLQKNILYMLTLSGSGGIQSYGQEGKEEKKGKASST